MLFPVIPVLQNKRVQESEKKKHRLVFIFLIQSLSNEPDILAYNSIQHGYKVATRIRFSYLMVTFSLSLATDHKRRW